MENYFLLSDIFINSMSSQTQQCRKSEANVRVSERKENGSEKKIELMHQNCAYFEYKWQNTTIWDERMNEKMPKKTKRRTQEDEN